MAAADSPAIWTTQQRQARTNQLLTKHHDLVFRYAYRLTGCRSSAEDIAQEVFLLAFRSIEQLRDASAERGWLMAIARNEFARWFCRTKAVQRAVVAEWECGSHIDGAEQEIERRDWVQAALDQLPDEFRGVVLMYYFEQLSYFEIASALDIPIGTVMSRLSRGKNHLKRCLDDVALPQ